MHNWKVVGVDRSGKSTALELRAASEPEAIELARTQGVKASQVIRRPVLVNPTLVGQLSANQKKPIPPALILTIVGASLAVVGGSWFTVALKWEETGWYRPSAIIALVGALVFAVGRFTSTANRAAP